MSETDDSPDNFTPRAQQVLTLARKEAARFHHNFVGTEHLLLGLIRLGQGVAANALQELGLDLETVRHQIETQIPCGPDEKAIGLIPFTPRAKRVLTLAGQEAKALNHSYVGTEHILLGLIQEGDGVVARVLEQLDVDLEQTREEILQELDPNRLPGSDTESAETPSKAEPSMPQSHLVDTSKRYDVYCKERTQEIVVYRNALFKARKALLPRNEHDLASEFLELVQADGQTLFVARASVIKFCEPGVTPGSQTVSGP